MKVFVDTSVWINYLGGRTSVQAARLSELLEASQPLFTLAVVVQEVLQGFKNEQDADDIETRLSGLNTLSFEFEDALEAARLYRSLRKEGITATTIDLQIATVCLRHGLRLLTDDKDFHVMSQKLNLKLA